MVGTRDDVILLGGCEFFGRNIKHEGDHDPCLGLKKLGGVCSTFKGMIGGNYHYIFVGRVRIGNQVR